MQVTNFQYCLLWRQSGSFVHFVVKDNVNTERCTKHTCAGVQANKYLQREHHATSSQVKSELCHV